jgi:hypothetical protein
MSAKCSRKELGFAASVTSLALANKGVNLIALARVPSAAQRAFRWFSVEGGFPRSRAAGEDNR